MPRMRFLLEGLLKLLVAAACLVGAVAAYRFLLHPWIEHAFALAPGTSSIVRRVGILSVVVLSYWGFVRLYEHRPATELAPRLRWTLLAAVAGSASIGVTLLALHAAGQYQLVAVRDLAPAGGVLAMLWIAAVMEEVAFRAILFRLLEERIGTMPAVGLSALVFSVVHLSNHGAGAVTFVTVLLAGLMWAGVYVLSRNVWVTAAHHFAWNSTIFLIGLPLSGEEDVRVRAPLETIARGSTLWTGGAFGPEDSLINVVVCSLVCLGLWRWVRRRDLAAGGPAL